MAYVHGIGTTLLLGCTRQLIPLSDVQMDLDPWYAAPTVVRQDWVTNTLQYTNILADGSLNLDKNLWVQTCAHLPLSHTFSAVAVGVDSPVAR